MGAEDNIAIPSIFEERQRYSQRRMKTLRRRVAEEVASLDIPNLVIFAAGSYARDEASRYSDVDLFFVYNDDSADQRSNRMAELQLFGRLIDIASSMRFPTFSNDGEYLKTISCQQILDNLGNRNDDALNHFTVRMLLLLESKPVYGDSSYERIVQRIVNAYYRDYPDHKATFAPWFLLNDIGRYWKTLLLNYENRRNPDDPDKVAQKVRNFKLKFSRMTTCFASVAALGVKTAPVVEDDILAIVRLTPRERLEYAAEARPETKPVVRKIFNEYAWFLGMMGLTQRQLRRHFEDTEERRALFARANVYGGLMYELLATLDTRRADADSTFLRFLVI